MGCQFVFGIDEYEPGAPGSGSAGIGGATGAGDVNGGGGTGGDGEGSRAGSGGAGSSSLGGNGTGGDCTCADGDGWTYVAFDKVTPADEAPSSDCNLLSRINLFGGAIAGCSPCISTPQVSSCAAPGLRCFQAGCAGAFTDENPGSGCNDMVGFGEGYDNCVPKGPVGPPVCANPTGGLPTATGPVLAASFCRGCSYCLEDQASCIVNESTVPASACADRGFPVVYTLRESPEGSAQCTPCGVPEGPCNGQEVPYAVGTVVGCGVDLDPNECAGVVGFSVTFGRYNVTSSCASAAANGSFNYTAPARTVCCKTDLLGPHGLTPEP